MIDQSWCDEHGWAAACGPLHEMTSTDHEPPEGTVVIDADGRRWRHVGGPGQRNWFPLADDGSFDNDDPETWTRVAGNFGPVTLET